MYRKFSFPLILIHCLLICSPIFSYTPLSKKFPDQLNYFLKDAKKDFEREEDGADSVSAQSDIDQNWKKLKSLDTEIGLNSILYLDDGSIISGFVHNTEEEDTYLVKTSFGEIKIKGSSIVKVLNSRSSKYIKELRTCKKNQEKIKKALKNYYHKYGKKGIKRLQSWSKETKYLLILQVEHEFERIPQCPEKFAKYNLVDPREGCIKCSFHGNIDKINKGIRKILFNQKKDN
jgi:hypothetical protein